jgi:hypothetical protein
MKKALLAIAVTAIIIVSVSAVSVAHLAAFNGTYQEASPSASAVSAFAPTSVSTLTPTPTEAPPKTQTENINVIDIQLSQWQPPANTVGSIALIDYPYNNAVYHSSNVSFTIHAGIQASYVMIDVELQIDGSDAGQLFNNMNNGLVTTSGVTVTATITGLSQGSHTLTVISNSACGPMAGSSTINFTVKTSSP